MANLVKNQRPDAFLCQNFDDAEWQWVGSESNTLFSLGWRRTQGRDQTVPAVFVSKDSPIHLTF